jgi:hypothetical protein
VQDQQTLEPRSGLLVGVGLAFIAFFMAVLLILMAGSDYDIWGAMFVAPVLIAVSLPALARQARREGDRWLFVFLVVALLMKLGGAVARHYVAFDVYGGVADANSYDRIGTELAANFRAGNWATGLPDLSGTHFIEFITGILYAMIGPTLLGGFLFFSWLGFWGLFFFYRAFVIAVPEGNRRAYARLLFFLPSLVFWPSSIGKESWMMFALGITAFGAAHIMTGRTVRGLSIAGLGLWLAAMPRPHVAGLMALGIAIGYLFKKPRENLRELAPVVKGIALTLVGVVALVFLIKASEFLKENGIDTGQGVTSALRDVTYRTTTGESSFVPSVLESPFRAPVAILTVLFRPFVFEAHNMQALAAALEGTFLLGLSLLRFRWGLAALRSVRRQPYVAFAVAYAGLFILAFSSFANFGLLARERVQLFPVFVLLLAIPPPKEGTGDDEEGDAPHVEDAALAAPLV